MKFILQGILFSHHFRQNALFLTPCNYFHRSNAIDLAYSVNDVSISGGATEKKFLEAANCNVNIYRRIHAMSVWATL